MSNFELGKRIKALRTSKALSQEELAQQAGISLRTVQRIENDEAEPRGDTLIRLAAVLNVKPEELVEVEKPNPADKRYSALLNLSAFTFIGFPLVGVFIPFLIWVLNKSRIINMDEAGKKLLNFQLSWCISLFLVFAAPIIIGIIGSGFLEIGSLFFLLLGIFGMYLLNFVFIISNTIKSLNSQRVVFYKPAVSFIK